MLTQWNHGCCSDRLRGLSLSFSLFFYILHAQSAKKPLTRTVTKWSQRHSLMALTMLNGQTLAWYVWTLTGQRLGGTQDRSFWRDALAHQLWVFNHCIMSRHHHVYSLLAPSVEKQFLSSVLWVASPSNHRPPSLMVWFLKHKTSSFLTSSPKCVLNERQNM